MKTLLTTTMLFLVLGSSIYGQSGSINNTLGAGGTFTIKDSTTNYFTLSQSTGNVSLFRNMELGGMTHSTSSSGVITQGGVSFIHSYRGWSADGFNIFIGLAAGNFTMNGSGLLSSYNIGVGYQSLSSLTVGYRNVAFGWRSLISNTSGHSNSAFGHTSLYNNASGYENSAVGYQSLYNTTGNENTALGSRAGSNISTGSNNIAIGYNAQVPTPTGDNQIRLGNASITYAGIQVAWTVTSDRRYKDNITPIGLGLGFISMLNPVSYERKHDEKRRTEYGLIAQEVEEVLKDCGVENHAMITITDEGMYELRYNDLIAPMIKAIQELKCENDALKKEITQMRATIVKQVKEELRNVLLNAIRVEEPIVKASLQNN